MDKQKLRKLGKLIVLGYLGFQVISFLFNGLGVFSPKSWADLKTERTTTYLDVFNDDIKNDLILGATSYSDRREPISTFRYQQDDYIITVWELLTNNNVPLTVQVVPSPSKVISYKPYQAMGFLGVNTSITQDSLEKRDTVFLYLKGRSLKEELINDSLLIYTFFLEDMSLSFEERGPILFAADKKVLSAADKRPSEIAFYRKQGRNYFITMFPVRDNTTEVVKLSELL